MNSTLLTPQRWSAELLPSKSGSQRGLIGSECQVLFHRCDWSNREKHILLKCMNIYTKVKAYSYLSQQWCSVFAFLQPEDSSLWSEVSPKDVANSNFPECHLLWSELSGGVQPWGQRKIQVIFWWSFQRPEKNPFSRQGRVDVAKNRTVTMTRTNTIKFNVNVSKRKSNYDAMHNKLPRHYTKVYKKTEAVSANTTPTRHCWAMKPAHFSWNCCCWCQNQGHPVGHQYGCHRTKDGSVFSQSPLLRNGTHANNALLLRLLHWNKMFKIENL